MPRAAAFGLVISLTLMTIGEVHADTRPARVRLDMGDSPCIDSASLGALVNRVLGRDAITPGAPDFVIDLSIDHEALRARILLRDIHGRQVGARTLELESGSCADLTRPLPFIIGMLLDLHVSDAVLHVPPETSEPVVAPPSGRLGFALGVGALTGYGTDAMFGASFSSQLQFAPFLLRLDLESAPYAELRWDARGTNLSLLGARLGVGSRLEIGSAAIEIQVHLSGSLLRAEGHGFTENLERWGTIVATGLRVGFTVDLDPSWFLGIDLAGDVRIVRQTFVFMNADGTSSEAFSTAPIGLSTFFRGGVWIDL
jgi:hypothetical protein